jgi:tRNA-splicing ligase RtcB
MNTKDFVRLGIPLGEATRRATDFVSQFILSGGDKTKLEEELKAIIANPALFAEDPLRKELAKATVNAPPPPRAEPVKYRQWGEGLEHEAVMQMKKACLLPVAVAGALMPDAHVGYGLPIGGVLATENAVIPYAVGVDIACRMKMTVLDVPVRELERHPERLTRGAEAETAPVPQLSERNPPKAGPRRVVLSPPYRRKPLTSGRCKSTVPRSRVSLLTSAGSGTSTS